MSRSQSVREEALRLDGYRCQVCGADRDTAVLEVHHVRPLGMGGAYTRDVVENCITLCAEHHQDVENGKRWIQEFDRDRNVFVWCDQMHKPMNIELWFYRRQDAERGEQITTRLSAYAMIDKDVARDAHELRQVFKAVDPESRSFKEYLAERGIDPRLDRAAQLYSKSLDCDVRWEEGVTATDYRRMLRDAGKSDPRKYFYAKLPPGTEFYRTANEQKLRDQMDFGEKLVKIGKTVWGLRSDRGVLVDPDGNEMEVVHV